MSVRKWDDDLPSDWEDATDSPPRDERDDVVLEEINDVFVLRLRLRNSTAAARPSDCLVISNCVVDVEP